MPHRYPRATRLLPAACFALAALARPVAAQSTEQLLPRPVPLHLAPPDSLAQLPKAPVSNLLIDKMLGICIYPAPAQHIFFLLTTAQPLLS